MAEDETQRAQAAEAARQFWQRLRTLEEHRNALQLAFVALAREMPEESRRRLMTTTLPALARAAKRKGEPAAAALLRVLERSIEGAPEIPDAPDEVQ